MGDVCVCVFRSCIYITYWEMLQMVPVTESQDEVERQKICMSGRRRFSDQACFVSLNAT